MFLQKHPEVFVITAGSDLHHVRRSFESYFEGFYLMPGWIPYRSEHFGDYSGATCDSSANQAGKNAEIAEKRIQALRNQPIDLRASPSASKIKVSRGS